MIDRPIFIHGYIIDVTSREKQLTKVKDLLVKLSICLEGHSNNNFEYELIKQAEQFLKECKIMTEIIIFIICLLGMFLWGYMIGGGGDKK